MYMGIIMPLVLTAITLGMGYLVICFARKESGNLKSVGYIIGTIILAISAALIIGNFTSTLTMCNRMKMAGPGHHMMMNKGQPQSTPAQK